MAGHTRILRVFVSFVAGLFDFRVSPSAYIWVYQVFRPDFLRSSASLNADPRLLDDGGPRRSLLPDARAELLRRGDLLLQPQALHRGPHVGILQRLERVLVDARDDILRRRGGHDQAVPLN